MVGNLLAIALLVAALIGLAFGLRAAWRTGKPLVRWPAALIGGVVMLFGIVVSGASFRGVSLAYSKGGRPVQAMTIERTPERIERGKHIVGNWCVGCHSPTKELPAVGGVDIAKEIPPPIGSLVTANLTPNGRIKDWTDGEVFRAIREGVDPQGNKLLVMSGQYARYLSDEDLKSVIAFLRSQEPGGEPTPPGELTLLGLAMAGANMLPSIAEPPPESVPHVNRDTTAAYGQYMASWMNCRECHGPNLAGVSGGLLGPAPSLRVAQTWTADQFLAAMKTGVTPYGKTLDSLRMPWRNISRFGDDELRAIHAYLRTVEIPLPPQ